VGDAGGDYAGQPARLVLYAFAAFRGTFRDIDRQLLGIAVSQYAAAGTAAVLVFRRLERVAARAA